MKTFRTAALTTATFLVTATPLFAAEEGSSTLAPFAIGMAVLAIIAIAAGAAIGYITARKF